MSDRVRSGSPFEETYGFCRARRDGDRIEVSGTAPIEPDGAPAATTAADQFRRCAAIAIAAVEELGGSVGDVVRTRMFITDPALRDEIGRAHREAFGDAEPVATMIVTQLLDPTWLVELEVEAAVTN